MRYFVTIEGEEHVMDVVKLPTGSFEVRPVKLSADGSEQVLDAVPAELSTTGGLSTVHLDGKVFDLSLDGDVPGEVQAYANGHRAKARVETERSRAAASVRGGKSGSADGTIKSPMPGKVVKVLVTEGQEVAAGTPVIVVEAMKMENELVAEGAGTVKKVFVAPGDAVEGGAKLVTIA
ncbi:MAG: biotin attachment protein [Polyangiaceae bacterium]|nr:biotin/lipoyl-binding protein [Myxococcales bacterium]MCB9590272.1 biotin attachment protein [Polyangiaceae bacterium]MCB9605073.1 biotin attachment protein [Polyangiaceae bacterium]